MSNTVYIIRQVASALSDRFSTVHFILLKSWDVSSQLSMFLFTSGAFRPAKKLGRFVPTVNLKIYSWGVSPQGNSVSLIPNKKDRNSRAWEETLFRLLQPSIQIERALGRGHAQELILICNHSSIASILQRLILAFWIVRLWRICAFIR